MQNEKARSEDFFSRVSKNKLIAPFFLLLITFAIFFPVRHFDYLAIDDAMHTESNPRIAPATLSNIATFWRLPYENAYTPLTYSLWVIEAAFAHNSPAQTLDTTTTLNPAGNKYNPGVFHFGNLVVHLLGTLLVYQFLLLLLSHCRLTKTASQNQGNLIGAAFLGAALFAFHPMQVETVCWITGLRDVLAGALSIAYLIAYLKYCDLKLRDEKVLPVLSGWNATTGYYLLSIFLFFLATLAKASALCIPLIGAMIALLLLKRKPLTIILETAPLFVLSVPLVRIFLSLNNGVANHVVLKTPLGLRPFIALDAIAFYLYKLFFPFVLLMDYGRTPQMILQNYAFVWTSLAAAAIIGISSVLAARSVGLWVFTALVIFLLGLSPILGLSPFIFQHISTVADRYAYLALLGPAIAIGWTFLRWGRRKEVRYAAAILVTFWCVKSTFQVQVWRNNDTLFSHVLESNTHSWLASNDLGTVYENRANYAKAYQLYKRAAELSNIASAWNNAGAMALKNKDYPAAIQAFSEALITSGDSAWAYNNLGTAFAESGDLKLARMQFQKALERAPSFRFPKINLAAAKKHLVTFNYKVGRSDKDL